MDQALLTGATGVVGNALLHELLKRPVKVYLLIRAANESELTSKLTQLRIENLQDLIPNQIEIVKGDIALNNLGIQQEQYQRLTNCINIIIHSAANVSLNQPLELARKNALGGTKAMVDFAWRCNHLQHFNYLSTVGVNGTSKQILLEQEPPQGIQYHNTYEQAKAEAELFLFEHINKGLPCTVYRPSMIVGNSKTGEMYAKQVFYYICDFMKMGGIGRMLPDLSHFNLDTIPINCLADFVINSTFQKETIGKVFNVCAGYEQAINLKILFNLIEEVLSSRNMKIRKHITLPVGLMKSLLAILEAFSTKEISNKIKSVSYLLSYLKQSPQFSNEHYLAHVSKYGLEIPTPTQYLPRVVENYFAN
jgi:thioester reductase-like protein